jgi:hypothetical protein
MKQQVTLIDSNSAAFPAGSQIWVEEAYRQLTTLADLDVEDVTYCHSTGRVDIRTALGYRFTISTADYDRLLSSY